VSQCSNCLTYHSKKANKVIRTASTHPLHSAHSASHIPEQDHEVSSRLGLEEASATGEGNHPGTAASNRERDGVGSDDEEQPGEEEGAEGSSTRPPLTRAIAAVKKMAFVGRLTVLHDDLGELDSGHASYYSQRRKLTVANDDYADLNENNLGYVRRVYTAITTTPAAMDDEQTKVSYKISH
jgi:hypothetical protein